LQTSAFFAIYCAIVFSSRSLLPNSLPTTPAKWPRTQAKSSPTMVHINNICTTTITPH